MSLAATAGAAPEAPSAPRPVVLSGRPDDASLIYLAPGAVTLILLDAPIVRESVQVKGGARFVQVYPSDQSLTLVPAAPLRSSEQIELRFTYREGFPSSAVLLLTAHPDKVDTMVSVSRPPQTVESCRVELTSVRERCEVQRQEVEALKAQPRDMSPAAVALLEWGDRERLGETDLDEACGRSSGELRPARCRSFGAAEWSVAVLEVSNPGPEPWTPSWAEATPEEGGRPRRASRVLSRLASIPAGGRASVSVEVRMPPRLKTEWLKTHHTLRVCDAAATRCVSIPGVRL